jgi:hypothetical protein
MGCVWSAQFFERVVSCVLMIASHLLVVIRTYKLGEEGWLQISKLCINLTNTKSSHPFRAAATL